MFVETNYKPENGVRSGLLDRSPGPVVRGTLSQVGYRIDHSLHHTGRASGHSDNPRPRYTVVHNSNPELGPGIYALGMNNKNTL